MIYLRNNCNRLVILIMLYWVVRGVFLTVVTPYMRGPDELSHTAYIEFIANNYKRGCYASSCKEQDKARTSCLIYSIAEQTSTSVKGTKYCESFPVGSTRYVMPADGKIITGSAHPTFPYLPYVAVWKLDRLIDIDIWSILTSLRFLSLMIGFLSLILFYLNLKVLFRDSLIEEEGALLGLTLLVVNQTFAHVTSLINPTENILFLFVQLSFYLFLINKKTVAGNILLGLSISAGFNSKLFFIPVGVILVFANIYRLIFASEELTWSRKRTLLTAFVVPVVLLAPLSFISNMIMGISWAGLGDKGTAIYDPTRFKPVTNFYDFWHNGRFFQRMYRHFWGHFGPGKRVMPDGAFIWINFMSSLALLGLLLMFVKKTIHAVRARTKLTITSIKDYLDKNFDRLVVISAGVLFIAVLTFNLYKAYKIHGVVKKGLHGRYLFSSILFINYTVARGLLELINISVILPLICLLMLFADLTTIFNVLASL